MARQGLAEMLGLPLDRVRVQAAPLGGAFGGKLMISEPLAAAAALKLGRPVRLVFRRSEDFAAANPAPGPADRPRAGRDARRRADRDPRPDRRRPRRAGGDGRRDDLGAALRRAVPLGRARPDRGRRGHQPRERGRLPRAGRAAGGVRGRVADRPAGGRAATSTRSSSGCRTCWSPATSGLDGQEIKVFGARECLERVQEHPLWQRRGALPEDEGVGVALGFWPGGLEPAAAICKLDSDGKLTVVTAAADMSGIENAFIAIAAETFGLAEDSVRVVTGDTVERALRRRRGRLEGHLHVRAGDRARRRRGARAAAATSPPPSSRSRPRTSSWSTARCARSARPAAAIAVADLAAKTYTFGSPHEPIEGYGGVAQVSRAPGAAAHLSHVRVDRETGGVTVLAHVIAQDVGKALNPALVEGQMHGGTAQGIGWALLEELAHDENGQLRGGSFAEYALPSTDQVPPIETLIVEVPAPDGPFGAKGIGEPPVCGVPAAIANAIAAATGARMTELPMSPLRVWTALSATWNAWPARRTVASSKWRPTSIIPIGRPSDMPHGTLSAGLPVTSNGDVLCEVAERRGEDVRDRAPSAGIGRAFIARRRQHEHVEALERLGVARRAAAARGSAPWRSSGGCSARTGRRRAAP